MSDSSSILYLHGFASSPQSRKARLFADRLGAQGVPVTVPDLAQGDFKHLTVSRQLALIETLVGDDPAVLIGSSLGGYLAALYSARHSSIEKVVLLAPAFGLRQLWTAELGAERLSEWQRNGTMDVFHYGESRELPLSYEFFEDMGQYEPFPDMQQPALVCHGIHDAVVPIEQSEYFVGAHPRAKLVRLTSGHELTDVLESVWHEAQPFLLDGAQ